MRMLIPLLLAALWSVAAQASEEEDVLATLREAERQHAAALAQEHGWSVTEPFIEQARKALAAGDLETAKAHADRALLTAGQSLLQAEREAEVWQRRALGK